MTRMPKAPIRNGTDIIDLLQKMVPCLKEGERIKSCQIMLVNSKSMFHIWAEGGISRVDCEKDHLTETYYASDGRPPEISNFADIVVDEHSEKIFEGLSGILGKECKLQRRGERK